MTETYRQARTALREILAHGRDRFVQLFSGSPCDITSMKADWAPLRELGLLEIGSMEARAITPLIAFDNLFVRCDMPSLPRRDRVFPIHDDESLLLARWANVVPGGRALEIGTGAGIAVLRLAANGADKAIATDINPRVREFFDFNAALNGLSGRVEYVHSDVFEALNGDRFDTIVCNPPFVSVPSEARYFIHSDGGPLGTAVLEKIALDLGKHLRRVGRMYAVAVSLGTDSHWRLSEVFPHASVSSLYSPVALADYIERFRWAPGQEKWSAALQAGRYTKVGYFALCSGANSQHALEGAEKLAREMRHEGGYTPWSHLSWSMEARLARYIPSVPTTS